MKMGVSRWSVGILVKFYGSGVYWSEQMFGWYIGQILWEWGILEWADGRLVYWSNFVGVGYTRVSRRSVGILVKFCLSHSMIALVGSMKDNKIFLILLTGSETRQVPRKHCPSVQLGAPAVCEQACHPNPHPPDYQHAPARTSGPTTTTNSCHTHCHDNQYHHDNNARFHAKPTTTATVCVWWCQRDFSGWTTAAYCD